jgi:hypothetical protein
LRNQEERKKDSAGKNDLLLLTAKTPYTDFSSCPWVVYKLLIHVRKELVFLLPFLDPYLKAAPFSTPGLEDHL